MAGTCVEELTKIYNAIMALNSGQRVVGVSIGERSVQYYQQQIPDLQKLYRVFYRQCGADSGLVDLSDSSMVLRGPPARIPR
ncbi:hypothetical protein Hden_1218 [Hyphomicrobium denitrificans ATCC 51888]|uniref:Uncharacterized protein n=1 Tax=Hyphomicrobium denitrificans (strain ATCC 51888 / DSM 1869 / NCIMB 11706 / TK 0415) TaxID=582899 RepID=D8JWB7_HYPDA|nr:hypothetical protein Hden_1218 [Hyphomicrobium denitrificans ATCC 51888]